TWNDFAKAVILRISEARDLGEINGYAFYERMKIYAAAPPDTLRINSKHLRQYYILNCCSPIITTNYAGGLYLLPDDRRYYVAWSERTKEDFDREYWNGLWNWYYDGGFEHVAAFLATLDLSKFDPKAPPPLTEAFWTMVNTNRPSEEAEIQDLIDR